MSIFKNSSGKDVNIIIDNKSIGIIKAGQQISFDGTEGNVINLVLSHTEESYGKFKRAHILIETTYKIQVEDGTEYSIKREKMRIENDAYYDCFFLHNGEESLRPVEYKVVGIEKLKKELIHKGFLWKFVEALEDMAVDLIFAPIRTIAIAILIVVFLGWKWLFAVGGCIYALYLAGNCMGTGIAKFVGGILGGKFKEESMEVRLNRWTDSNSIAEFYSKPDRKPYMGKIER